MAKGEEFTVATENNNILLTVSDFPKISQTLLVLSQDKDFNKTNLRRWRMFCFVSFLGGVFVCVS